MMINTPLSSTALLPQELSRAQQPGRLGEAPHLQHRVFRVTRAERFGLRTRLALARLI